VLHITVIGQKRLAVLRDRIALHHDADPVERPTRCISIVDAAVTQSSGLCDRLPGTEQ